MLKTGSGTLLIINRELLFCTLLNQIFEYTEETFTENRVEIDFYRQYERNLLKNGMES